MIFSIKLERDSLKYCANSGNDLQEQPIKLDFNVVRNENAITFISISLRAAACWRRLDDDDDDDAMKSVCGTENGLINIIINLDLCLFWCLVS